MARQIPNPRILALQILRKVLQQRHPLDQALNEHKALAALSTRDRAFAHLLLASVLRRLGQIDALIDHCLDRPLKPKLAEVRDILRLGVAQLVFLHTPAHAAVNTTVALVEGSRQRGHKGLINAVLRRLTREGAALAKAQDAARLNTPDWLWQSWCEAYGEVSARAIAEAHLNEPPLDLTVKPPTSNLEHWAERLGAEALPTGSLRLPRSAGDITQLPGYATGDWWVQDAAAALPARLLGDVAGKRALDLCAAPGGKTAELAAAGAEVTAIDISPKRLKRLTGNLKRLGLTAQTVEADASSWRPAQPADAVLLDAPCSATGTIRRHPDIPWLKTPDDVIGLVALQDRLLDAALDMTAPGGLLVYATCSLQPEEGPQRIARLLADGAPATRLPVTANEVGGLAELITADGELRSLPYHLGERGGMDGFYACRLRRT